MTAPSHIVTGLASIVVVGRISGVTPDAVGLLAFIIGSLASDIDGEGSITRPGKILWRFVGPAIGNLLDAIFELFSAVLKLFFSHRGFIHSPFIACCFIGLGFALDKMWLIWFGGG